MFKRSMIMMFLVLSLFLPIVCQNSFAGSLPIRFGSVQEMEDYFGGSVTFYSLDGAPLSDVPGTRAIYKRGPYGVDSKAGYDNEVMLNGKTNKFRVRYAKLLATNWGDITNNTFLVSVAAGQTKRLKQAIELCNSVTVSGSVSASFKSVINAQIDVSTTSSRCETVSTELEFTFPVDECDGNTVSFYAGMIKDHYEIESNWVPYYRDKQALYEICVEHCHGNYIIGKDDAAMDDSSAVADCIDGCAAAYPKVWHMANKLTEVGSWNEPHLIIYSVCSTVPR